MMSTHAEAIDGILVWEKGIIDSALPAHFARAQYLRSDTPLPSNQ
tara:strand:- start:84 stop:218 length:135 start_codon:yes stop_codon:yes gene_type:complete